MTNKQYSLDVSLSWEPTAVENTWPISGIV